MKEYLFLFRGGDHRLEFSPEAGQAHTQEWMQWMGGLAEKGQLGATQPLSGTGHVVTGTKKTVTDGPFMEGKEMIGGFMVCKAGNYNEALNIANGCPILQFEDGTVEIREVQEMNAM